MSSACHSCGRSSSYFQAVSIAGQLVHTSPSQMVYTYRDGQRIGLCDDCFRQRRFDGLSHVEIEYLAELFDLASNDDSVA